MAKEFHETILIQGGFAGQFYDINQGPLLTDVIDVLLQNSGTSASTLQENTPLYISSTGTLSADRTLDISLVEQPGRMFYFRVNNSDIGTNNITIDPSVSINGVSAEVITLNGDYLLVHQSGGIWRMLALWSYNEKSDLELELEYKFTNLTNYKQLSYTGNNLTSVNIYETSALTVLLFSKTLSYTGNNLTQTILTRASDGATVTKSFTYSGSKLTSVETS